MRLAGPLAAAAVLLGAAPAVAAPGPNTPVEVRLASQTPWVAPGGHFGLRVNVSATRPAAEVELAVSVFRRVTTRSEFQQTVQDRVRGAAIKVTSWTLSELTVDPGGAYDVELPVQDPAQPVDPERLRLPGDGVYPVRVEVRELGGGRSLARFVTHLVYASPLAPDAVKLDFALVAPVHAPLALRPDGTRKLAGAAAGGLAALARGLNAHPDAPVTLQPTPETLEALAASPRDGDHDTLAALAQQAQVSQVVQSTYVPVALSSFTSSVETELAAQLERGAQLVDETLKVRPDPRTWVADEHLDGPSLQRLRNGQVDRLVVPDSILTPLAMPVPPAQPFELDNRQVRRPLALAANTGLAAHFAESDPVLAAQHVLADLAVLYFDHPGRPRVVVAVAPRAFAWSDAFLAPLLDGLTTSPIIAATTVERAFADIPTFTTPGGALVRRLVPAQPDGVSALPATEISRARRRLQAFASVLDPSNPLAAQLEERLLAAESVELRGRQRTSYVDGAVRGVDASLALVSLPADRTITLTARRGEIPITISSRTGFPLHLQIRVDSDKLEFRGAPARRSLTRPLDLVRPNTTELFSVQARTSGAFPMRVRLLSPDGSLTLLQSRFTVRSTAASGVGLVLSAGAGGFLLLWWARHLVRGRRNRRLVPA